MSDLVHPESYCRHGEASWIQCKRCADLIDRASFPLIGFMVEPGGCAKWSHDLKIAPEHLAEVISGRKTFEVRRNDRDFRAGDVVYLKEWDGYKFTGLQVSKYVPYLTDFEQKAGIVVMSLAPWNWVTVRQ
ncbi:DUF3850 domain-containing protein [Geothrix campi]|uniref:DUF3850 domain-containing protein n=1 Tax=Geothrix campi TaxID=2966450 RepID=UPI002148DE3B|nr:DUF3850 domain-containing protein [Geothrix sp. SG10]